ncbi:glycosyltransferase family 2 protein [Postechiella marina]|uniref:Glycosyltransferase family 2 protein n=1 Tax=Postechiella marina TaxID=943941 RepID=A0ABP8CEG0_9FLAO
MPFFSVVIPLYNKEKYILKTLESVINQTFIDFEIIVINDGSTDGSLNQVKKIKDSRLFTYSQENHGLSAARNVGIKKAKSNYIALLDADDLWCEDYLQTIFNIIKRDNTLKIIATAAETCKENTKINLRAEVFNENQIVTLSNYFSLKRNIFTPSSLVIKKNIFESIGFFDDKINYGEEEDFFIRCFSLYHITHYKSAKVYYLTGIEGQLTSPNQETKRIIPDYTKYLTNKNEHKLKPYIDFIYYKLVVLYKMEKNDVLVNFYKAKIDVSNLSFEKKIKYYLPTKLFYSIKKTYIWLKSFSHS